ncbi:bifunctional riboflavin kinase/FAD synthetase [Candidatus Bandiella numerosa]|uniref:bifunctional riboflavin kinase/FAD synthetase n=1 Tax=Candidatus Bandiella numerosa TaxID=2570586 RepID=UPI00249F7BF6|nr:bifunctional riboflavin kinase/FAD synthetase [Candidatus Bandiella numerosa]WHA04855.1 bifunctional riboflavin kinase/FAD synthetase [Candidatus Bandiella numerosa]
MIVHNCNINSNISFNDLILAIGNFDGVHLGHQKIINRCIDLAKKHNFTPAILTFHPHPSQFINGDGKKKLIYNNVQKISLIRDLNIAHLFILEFNNQVINIPHDKFVEDILIKMFKVKGVISGYNFFFGKNRLGNTDFLKTTSKQYGFIYNVVDKFDKDFIEVSSSKIRNLLSSGMIETANKILGRRYFITGNVIYGKKLARTLGFQTANIKLDQNYVYPLNGVYLVKVIIDDMQHTSYFGVANIGIKPTVLNDKTITLETHIFEFNDDIYGKNITIEFISFLRPERNLKNLDKLKNQIKKDISDAKYIIMQNARTS